MYQWKSEKINRTHALPRLNCYTRISPDNKEIPWFLLSSNGLLRNSWGKYNRFLRDTGKDSLFITRYEAGVLFIPKFFINRDTFPISEETSSEVPTFLLPFDVPLTPYELDDEPHMDRE